MESTREGDYLAKAQRRKESRAKAFESPFLLCVFAPLREKSLLTPELSPASTRSETRRPISTLTTKYRSILVEYGVQDYNTPPNAVPDCLVESCHKSADCGVFTVERAVIDERTS
jgi:hypothetical protein